MRMTLAAIVVGLGVIVTVAGGAALYSYAIVADETGISGWNPMLWIVILAGIATVLIGTLQIAFATGDGASVPQLD